MDFACDILLALLISVLSLVRNWLYQFTIPPKILEFLFPCIFFHSWCYQMIKKICQTAVYKFNHINCHFHDYKWMSVFFHEFISLLFSATVESMFINFACLEKIFVTSSIGQDGLSPLQPMFSTGYKLITLNRNFKNYLKTLKNKKIIFRLGREVRSCRTINMRLNFLVLLPPLYPSFYPSVAPIIEL